MKNHASLKKIALLCPFCKVTVVEDMVSTDTGIYGFLEAELATLRKLPQNRQKLFAFSSIYLPHLHKFMKEEVKGDVKKDKKGSQREQKTGYSIDSIELLRISMGVSMQRVACSRNTKFFRWRCWTACTICDESISVKSSPRRQQPHQGHRYQRIYS